MAAIDTIFSHQQNITNELEDYLVSDSIRPLFLNGDALAVLQNFQMIV